ncbi:class F sortase [Actinoplanes sp. NPDC004185]
MSRHGRRAAGWTTLVAGLGALAVGLVLMLRPSPAPADAGVLPPPVVVSASTPPTAAARTRAPAPALWTPTGVTIDRLKVGAPVDPVGVTRDGALDVPDDPDRLGWWIGSVLPGERRGTVLIAGHVDTAEDGQGALYRLEKLAVGSRIEVRAGDRSIAYRVTARRSYAKSRLPEALFRRDTSPQLALVTCGGAFRNGTYDHNVVVYATPM